MQYVGKITIHLSAYWGRTEYVKLLLQYNSDVKQIDHEGKTLLHLTAE